VIFGANMTTLTLALSRAIGRTWRPGDEVLVTRSDHDANVTPWVLAARDAGAVVHDVNIRRDDCTLDLDDLRRKLTARTRLVAVGAASNATGTVHPVRTICDLAHDAGADVFVDAVHYAPHLRIDVRELACDFLACSAYKFFGPHVGILWGRRELLERLPAYKLRPASDELPDRWMTGTQNHEGIAGTLAAVEYLADLGRRLHGAATTTGFATPSPLEGEGRGEGRSAAESPVTQPLLRAESACGTATSPSSPRASRQDVISRSEMSTLTDRRAALRAACAGIEQYERQLLVQLLDGLRSMPEITVYGITDPARLSERVPTICFTHARLAPAEVAKRLAAQGIFVWHGNYYALPLTEALGLEPQGAVRVGLLHYNTADEVDRFLAAMAGLR
jgi:selenocysteine lyase/cysteine desulfurase